MTACLYPLMHVCADCLMNALIARTLLPTMPLLSLPVSHAVDAVHHDQRCTELAALLRKAKFEAMLFNGLRMIATEYALMAATLTRW